MICFFLVFYFLLTAIERCAARNNGPQVEDDDCDCFLINSTNPTYYSKHMFFDFRNLKEYAGVPDVVSDLEESSDRTTTSDYFADDDWTSVWQLQDWDNRLGNGKGLSKDATIVMVNSPSNVYIEENEDDDPSFKTFMTMRTKRLPKFQTAAEFQTKKSDYKFISIRMLARTIGSPGACTAMFTYRDSDKLSNIQEADIEFLTSGPRNRIQYTNQPSYSLEGDSISEATSNSSMPGDFQWSDWVVHRLDWTPNRSIWYVNGEETANIEFQTPRDASGINFNAWSNGGDWTGLMKVYDEVYFQIQWIQMVYNTTGKHRDRIRSMDGSGPSENLVRRKSKRCKAVCSIDEVDEAGDVLMLWESSVSGRFVAGGLAGWLVIIWISIWGTFWILLLRPDI